jgi:hypothetical protein
MKESRIIACIAMYGSLILANTSSDNFVFWSFIILAIIWAGRYICALKND